MNQNNPKLRPFSQKLRRDMTAEERHLWYDFLKSISVPVKRQKVFGAYIVDFYIPSAKLVIELDGSQHFGDAGMSADQARDQYLIGFASRYFLTISATLNTMASSNSRRSSPVIFLIFSRRYTSVLR